MRFWWGRADTPVVSSSEISIPIASSQTETTCLQLTAVRPSPRQNNPFASTWICHRVGAIWDCNHNRKWHNWSVWDTIYDPLGRRPALLLPTASPARPASYMWQNLCLRLVFASRPWDHTSIVVVFPLYVYICCGSDILGIRIHARQ